jgi:hypothetical protein
VQNNIIVIRNNPSLVMRTIGVCEFEFYKSNNYWVTLYLRKGVQVIQENWYTKFQKACSVADMWIATCAISGAIGLLTKQSYGLFFAILAGSSLIFLAILDIAFNIQNKLYRLVGKSGEMAL